tara:strand:- start:871 stop:1725 length:855 start_codon:yes stop_codon:yes gene_type:complete
MSVSTKLWRIIDLINWSTDYFKSNKIENPKREIEWFLCEILQCERIDLYIRFEEILHKSNLDKFKHMINQRVSGEPFQHIINKASFYGRDFFVNNTVLIPRPDTEIIIDIIKKNKCVDSILDVGTGSGCIAITIFLEKLANNVYATDISDTAIKTAQYNMEKHQSNAIKIAKHDFLNQQFKTKFDIVVSNPPYISKSQLKSLQQEVKNYDPEIALTDGLDGYSFYERFGQQFNNLLNSNGYMLLEFGGNQQKETIKSIFKKNNLRTEFFKDLQNDWRIVKITNE